MEWSLDFCLSCDRQISQSENGTYCSQSCHLADLERASTGSASPASTGSASPASYASSSAQSQPAPPPSAGFYLPPALNSTSSMLSTRQFSSSSAYPVPTARSPISSHHPHHHSFTPTATTLLPRSFDERKPKLYNSPSRSSLSSLNSYGHSDPSSSSSTGMSEKIKNELREYAGSFDHIRDWKRRMTVV